MWAVFLTGMLTAPAAQPPKLKPPPPFTIIGTWKVNSWTLQFDKDGSYRSREDPTAWSPQQPFYHGRWEYKDGELTIIDEWAQLYAPNQHAHITTHKSKITPNKDGLKAEFAWGNGQWKRVKDQ